MKRILMIAVLATMTSGLLLGIAAAAEPNPDQLRAEAKELRQKAEILQSQGKEADARELAERAERLIHEAEVPAERRQRAERERREHGEKAERERAEREPRERAEREPREMGEQREHQRHEIVERMQGIKREIDELLEAGKKEAAERLEHLLHELDRRLEELARPPHHPKPELPPEEQMRRRHEELKDRIRDLRNEGRHEEAERLQRESHELAQRLEHPEAGHRHHERRPEPPPHHGPPPEERIRLLEETAEHLHQAAERLAAAGIPELPDRLRHEAGQIEAEVRRQIHAQEAHRAFQELREEVGRLRHEMEALKGNLKHMPRRERD